MAFTTAYYVLSLHVKEIEKEKKMGKCGFSFRFFICIGVTTRESWGSICKALLT